MLSSEIRQKFLDFFESKGHKIVPSSSLVTDDPSVLFTTAGMQQFKPYYLGFKDAIKDFASKNTTSSQKCVRTNDIEEVGDDTHLTFFEMLGNFSFGGYWKKDAIKYAYEFITKELGLTIDYVSVFEGDAETPADNESRDIWSQIDPKLIIKNHNRADNFWGPTGNEGPCGPTTEIYINGVEIWNIVFNEYYKTSDGKYTPLDIKGIDTGMGLERLTVQVQKVKNVFETDIFLPLLALLPNEVPEKIKRIVVDHSRTVANLIHDGLTPSNKDRGYVLRRLIRRVLFYQNKYKFNWEIVLKSIIDKPMILETIALETEQFTKKLDEGLKEFEKGKDPFILFTSYGFPFELAKEVAAEKGIAIDEKSFQEKFKAHQDLSRSGAEQKFKGGLANTNEQTIKLHTAHHLLLAALQEILGREVKQRGSNITEERLRMDFSFPRKLTKEELTEAEKIVNKHIVEGLAVTKKEMPRIEAESIGAEMEFGAKYPDIVSLYFIEDKHGNAISKEFCGGPHVTNTSELGHFKISKEEAVSTGVRRIKAVLE
jgi:alanyl-tRNA synthetase